MMTNKKFIEELEKSIEEMVMAKRFTTFEMSDSLEDLIEKLNENVYVFEEELEEIYTMIKNVVKIYSETEDFSYEEEIESDEDEEYRDPDDSKDFCCADFKDLYKNGVVDYDHGGWFFSGDGISITFCPQCGNKL